MVDRNLLVDGNNLLHRAFAVFVKDKVEHDVMVSPSQYPTGLIYGMLSMLSSWITEISNPTRVVFFLDGVPARRIAADPEYKTKEKKQERPGSGDCQILLSDGYAAKNELSVVTHILSLLGVDVYHDLSEEADDVIASYVFSHTSDMNIIISSDIDFYQLMDGNDRVILFRPGSGKKRFFDAEAAEEHLLNRYHVHVPPGNVRMFKALTGDPSDGIRGVPRLRKKVAAPLCDCKSIEELFKTGLPGFSNIEKKNISLLKDRIKLNYDLIGLNNELDISTCITTSNPDFKVASQILREDLGINTVFPHIFRFEKSKYRTSPNTPYSMLPDFLKDI